MNHAACFAMGMGKHKAKRHSRRIPEKTLFLFPLILAAHAAVLVNAGATTQTG